MDGNNNPETGENGEEDEPTTTLFGMEIPTMDDDIQPLECLVLIKGINMETGMPVMTSLGTSKITPWEAIGMLRMEMSRLEMMGFMHMFHAYIDDEED